MTIEYRGGAEDRLFRDAMGCFATGITVVTSTDEDSAPIGITANSFASLSLDPPLLLVCIANESETGERLKQADHFAINVLNHDQLATSKIFANKSDDRFVGVDWTPGDTGAPLLAGSLGTFECARHEIYDGGDHFILVGRVLKGLFQADGDPLLYFKGRYRRLESANDL